MTVHEILTGVVELRNPRGILVEDQWCNVSKFAPLELPPIGSSVRVSVDNKGFIVALEVLEDIGPIGTIKSRGQTIARLTVLKAAAHFAAARTDIKSSDVLRIADVWLAWVEQ